MVVIRRIYVIAIIFLTPVMVLAQGSWEKPAGGIENAQVIIEKDKVISLRPVSRRFKAIQLEIPKPKPLGLTYQLADINDSLPPLQVIVRPKTMKDQPLDKLFGVTGKFGYGNFNSPFILVDAGNKRSDEYMYNLQFNHYSSGKGPVADKFSGAGLTRIGGTGKYFFNNVVLNGAVDYNFQQYNLYGYDPVEINSPGFNQDEHHQKLNQVGVRIGFADNNLKNDADHQFTVGIHLLNNNDNAKEFVFDADYELDWNLATDWSLGAVMEFSLMNQNAMSGTVSRKYGQISPVLGYEFDQFYFKAGLNSFYQQDPLDSSQNKFYFYPEIEVNYTIASNHVAGVGLSGGLEKISLDRLYEENLYLDSLVVANNNINNLTLWGKLDGKLAENFGYGLRYIYRHYKRIMFFDNNPTDTARFMIVYDEGGATQNRFEANLTYLVNDKLNFALTGAYNIYTTIDQAEAWHKPATEIRFTTNILLLNKLRGRLNYTMLEGIKAQTVLGTIETLDMIHDLNIGLDLEITERAGVFVDMRNILGSTYQVYNNYPVKGFQVVAGLGIKF